MKIDLNINISAKDKNSLKFLLEHIYKEVVEGPDYRNSDIENFLVIDGDWAVIKSKNIDGKYNWSIDNNNIEVRYG